MKNVTTYKAQVILAVFSQMKSDWFLLLLYIVVTVELNRYFFLDDELNSHLLLVKQIHSIQFIHFNSMYSLFIISEKKVMIMVLFIVQMNVWVVVFFRNETNKKTVSKLFLIFFFDDSIKGLHRVLVVVVVVVVEFMGKYSTFFNYVNMWLQCNWNFNFFFLILKWIFLNEKKIQVKIHSYDHRHHHGRHHWSLWWKKNIRIQTFKIPKQMRMFYLNLKFLNDFVIR